MDEELFMRRAVRLLSDAELAALRRAFAEVMALNDDRGYQFFAGLHGLPPPFYCEHGNPLFLPWHRAYLYMLEQALQDRVPGVAIPWWDWSSPASREEGIPAAYALPETDGAPNPLFAADVGLPPDMIALVRSRLPGAISDDDPPRTLRDPDSPGDLPDAATVQALLEAPTFEDFSLRMEDVHNFLHVWVGGSMAQVPTAAFDPIFWTHHAMVDRLWYLWQMRHPGQTPSAQLMGQVLAPFRMTVADTLNINDLGYDYALQVVA